MAGYMLLLAVYVLGGLTFIPLVLLTLFVHGYYSLPHSSPGDSLSKLDVGPLGEGSNDFNEKLYGRNHEPDVAAGYFAVCREYVPGGVNGKPPERTTPAGETIAAESPSVYQSMYRSIFERNKTQIPSIESGKAVKKARNVFYVVLRHGHLLLFDNSEQLEVRHVISLSFYHVDLYAGGEEIPEGELYIKRNCIRLAKRSPGSDDVPRDMPFYLFSDNCSEKEDFYHAILHSRANTEDAGNGHPVTQMFDTDDMIKLVRTLHLSDETTHVRWLNALAGRLFLGLYKTSFIEDFIRTKIEKKISRVSKPTFITSITLQQIDLGTSAPTVSNPRLKEITVDGSMAIEADLKYTGSFRVVISAVARIDLGSRFKPRTVTLVLATILKRLEGKAIVRVKPPPSNRLWVSFETAPKIELSVEPIVSSRQITYSIILRAIESRIREVVNDTFVSPNADDFPFFNTEGQNYRGGIWRRKRTTSTEANLKAMAQKHADDESATDDILADLKDDHVVPLVSKGKVASTPPLPLDSSPDIQDAFAAVSKPDRLAADSVSLPPSHVATPPKIMRSNSFASAATPIVTKDDPIIGDTNRMHPKLSQQDATRAMKELSMRSQEASPSTSPRLSARTSLNSWPSKSTIDITGTFEAEHGETSMPSKLDLNNDGPGSSVEEDEHPTSRDAPTRTPSHRSSASQSSIGAHTKLTSAERKAALNQSINSATAAAKKWGMGVLNRQQDWKKPVPANPPRDEPREPYGRGQPLPPPGVPLPKPATATGSWSAATLNALRRKPVSSAPQLPPRVPPRLPPRPSVDMNADGANDLPQLPRRHPGAEQNEAERVDGVDDAYEGMSANASGYTAESELSSEVPEHEPEHEPDHQPEVLPEHEPDHEPQLQSEHPPDIQPEHQPIRLPWHQPQYQPEHTLDFPPEHHTEDEGTVHVDGADDSAWLVDEDNEGASALREPSSP